VQRPAEFGERRLLTDQEFAKRQADIAANRIRLAGAWAEMGEANRLTSLVVDPPNGRLPALTDEGRKRATTMTSSWSDMLFTSVNDFNALDRCMTRGMPASMFPFMYNSGIEILQSPGYVVIRFELIHETRVIPLDGRPRPGPAIRFWLGEPRGRWEGRTLVVETTNFNGRSPMMIVGPGGGGIPTSDRLRVVERFTRVDEDTIDYEMTVEDPVVLMRPWKAAFPLKRDPSYYLFEYACPRGQSGHQQCAAELEASGTPAGPASLTGRACKSDRFRSGEQAVLLLFETTSVQIIMPTVAETVAPTTVKP
jgi:hypothetical protein